MRSVTFGRLLSKSAWFLLGQMGTLETVFGEYSNHQNSSKFTFSPSSGSFTNYCCIKNCSKWFLWWSKIPHCRSVREVTATGPETATTSAGSASSSDNRPKSAVGSRRTPSAASSRSTAPSSADSASQYLNRNGFQRAELFRSWADKILSQWFPDIVTPSGN